MTDDRVRWLRANISMWDHDYGMQTEAADRIEKLEAALRELLSLGEWGTNALARTIILDALDEKD